MKNKCAISDKHKFSSLTVFTYPFGLLDLFFSDSAFITFPESRYSERTFILRQLLPSLSVLFSY